MAHTIDIIIDAIIPFQPSSFAIENESNPLELLHFLAPWLEKGKKQYIEK